MTLDPAINKEIIQNYVIAVSKEPQSASKFDVRVEKRETITHAGHDISIGGIGYTTDPLFVQRVLGGLVVENPTNKLYKTALIIVNEQIRQIGDIAKKAMPEPSPSSSSSSSSHLSLPDLRESLREVESTPTEVIVTSGSPAPARHSGSTASALPEPAAAQGPSRDREPIIEPLMKTAQILSLKGEIGAAAKLIEEHAKKMGKSSIELLDICEGFDIQTNALGEKLGTVKGITTVGQYNDTVLLADDPTEAITTVKEIQVMLATGSPRGVAFFRQSDQTLHTFRRKGEGVEMFNRESKTWIACTQEMIDALNLKADNLLIVLGKSAFDGTSSRITFAEATPDSVRLARGRFYQEAQGTSQAFCALHAANAFVGYTALDMPGFYTFSRAEISKELSLSREEIYSLRDASDVRKGTDPKIIATYIESLAQSGALPSKYEHLNIIQVKERDAYNEGLIASIPADCDRLMVAYGGSHFAALRKDSSNSKWYLVDSLDDASQDTPYDTLVEAIKIPSRAQVANSLRLIY